MEDLWFVEINAASKKTAINVLIGNVTRMISGRFLNSISLCHFRVGRVNIEDSDSVPMLTPDKIPFAPIYSYIQS
jgi:hypothetical protein